MIAALGIPAETILNAQNRYDFGLVNQKRFLDHFLFKKKGQIVSSAEMIGIVYQNPRNSPYFTAEDCILRSINRQLQI